MKEQVAELLRSNLEHAKIFQDRFDQLQDSQEPDYVTVCCSDSRVLQDHMWGNEHPGRIFTVSNIGNRVFQGNGFISGDVLYPVEHTDTRTVIVVGHTGCGAVTATYRDLEEGLDEPEGIRYCIDQLRPLIQEGVEKLPEGLGEAEAVNRLVEYNVDRQVEKLIGSEEMDEDVTVIGVVYDFQDVYSGSRGECHVVNVDGEHIPSELKNAHPEIEDRIERLWSY